MGQSYRYSRPRDCVPDLEHLLIFLLPYYPHTPAVLRQPVARVEVEVEVVGADLEAAAVHGPRLLRR